MPEVASAFVTIAPSARGFGSKLNSEIGGDIDRSGKGAGKKFGAALKVGALGVLGGAALIGGFLKGSIGEARDAQKVGALTNAVIKSTGGVANVTAGQVDKLATSISLKTGVDDEAIAAGQNMLLTFGNVRNEVGKGNDVFSQATVAATDMAAAFGGDAVSNSKMLGKALNDPTKGVSALTRVGVSFTEGQKDQIKAMQESGDILGAQKIILGEVSKQTEGAAESQATAADKAKVAFGNLQEAVGTALLPAVDGLLNGVTAGITGFMDAFNKGGLSGVATLIGDKIEAALPVIKAKLLEWGTAFVEWVPRALPGLLMKLASLWLSVQQWIYGTALPKIVTALVGWGKAFVEWIGPQIGPMIERLAVLGQKVFNWLLDVGLPWLGRNLQKWAEAFIAWIGPMVGPAVAKLGEFGSRLFDWLISVGLPKLLTKLRTWADALIAWISPQIRPMVAAIGRLMGKLVGWIIGTGLPKLLGATLKLAVALVKWIAPQIPKVISGISGLVGMLLGWIVGTGLPRLTEKLQTMGSKAFQAFLDAAKRKLVAAVDYVAGIPARLVGALGDLGQLFYNKGVELISGLARGITAKMADAINAVKNGLSQIKGLLPGSPIKWGPLKGWNNGGAGKRLMDLVARGITEATPRTVKAAKDAFQKIGDALESKRDKLRSTLEGLKGDFASLVDSVSGAFTGDLFSPPEGTSFIDNLLAKKSQLAGLMASFTTLKGWGLDPSFLSQLFASGNGALITELAGMGQNGAMGAANLFGEVNSLGTQLGSAVANNDPLAKAIDEGTSELREVNRQLSFLADDIGKQLNGAASKARRTQKSRG